LGLRVGDPAFAELRKIKVFSSESCLAERHREKGRR
jgi:hypothetical protein